jgi:Domain of unknown function (DUF4157)
MKTHRTIGRTPLPASAGHADAAAGTRASVRAILGRPPRAGVADGGVVQAKEADHAIALAADVASAGGRSAVADVLRPAANRTGLPDRLKAGVEHLSGLALDDVRVHYNSPLPARFQALAYTQAPDIHIAPGEERHLPHEAWHAVQQKQGRVKPTLQVKGAAINDDAELEREADIIGAKAEAVFTRRPESAATLSSPPTQAVASSSPVMQRVVEIRYGDCAGTYTTKNLRSLLREIYARMKKQPQRAPLNFVNAEDKTYIFDSIETLIDYMTDLKQPDPEVVERAGEEKAGAADEKGGQAAQARRLVRAGMDDSSGVMKEEGNVEAHLDIDQLKHQPPPPAKDAKDVKDAGNYRIGTREKGGGNKFKPPAGSEAWHQANTLAHMIKWADGLKGMKEGVKVWHGQADPVDGVHYEGYCVLLGAKKFVFFHCYPADSSKKLKL